MRIAALVVLGAAIGWVLVLFGYGVDRLLHDHTRPGVIATVVSMPLVFAGLVWFGINLCRGRFVNRPAKPS